MLPVGTLSGAAVQCVLLGAVFGAAGRRAPLGPVTVQPCGAAPQRSRPYQRGEEEAQAALGEALRDVRRGRPHGGQPTTLGVSSHRRCAECLVRGVLAQVVVEDL